MNFSTPHASLTDKQSHCLDAEVHVVQCLALRCPQKVKMSGESVSSLQSNCVKLHLNTGRAWKSQCVCIGNARFFRAFVDRLSIEVEITTLLMRCRESVRRDGRTLKQYGLYGNGMVFFAAFQREALRG